MVYYAVLDHNGRPRGSYRGAPSMYALLSTAVNQARNAGDSVVRVVIDMEAEPLFIRQKKVQP